MRRSLATVSVRVPDSTQAISRRTLTVVTILALAAAERMRWLQRVGLLLAATGVVLLTA